MVDRGRQVIEREGGGLGGWEVADGCRANRTGTDKKIQQDLNSDV